MAGNGNTARLPPARGLQIIGAAAAQLRERLLPTAQLLAGLAEPLPRLLHGDADEARRLYRGVFTFAGRTVACYPAEVFATAAPSPAWRDQLHAFDWLCHLEAGGLAIYRAFARSLLTTWSLGHGVSAPEVTTARLLSLARHGAFLLQGAPAEFEATLLRAAGADVRRLIRSRVRTPAEALRQSAAVLSVALALRAPGQLQEEALARTAVAAAAVILPDGGPFDRSPKTLLAVLSLLVPLREQLVRRRIEVPQQLNAAIERAMPMLRMLSLGDGGLVLFQGADGHARAEVKALMARDPVTGRPLAHAAQSGYARLAQGETTVIVDCGASAACDAPLAIAFACGEHRLVGSCGLPANGSPAWIAAARRAPAHSTLDLECGATGSLDSFFLRRRKAPAAAAAELIASPHGTLVKARSDAHLAALGLVHHRELFLSANGHDFRGEDRFERHAPLEGGWPAAPFAFRFHLDPAVTVVSAKANAVVLELGSGLRWQFTARGGVVALEDSIFLATGGAPRAARQIVIRGITGRPDIVNWAFRRLDG